MSAKEEECRQKDDALRQKDEALRVKDEVIRTKDKSFRETVETLREKDEALRETAETLREKNANIQAQQADNQQLRDQLAVTPKVSWHTSLVCVFVHALFLAMVVCQQRYAPCTQAELWHSILYNMHSILMTPIVLQCLCFEDNPSGIEKTDESKQVFIFSDKTVH